jgi:hypothetical protein
MDLSSQRQYIQRIEVAHSILTTTDLTTFYTAPSGDDFTCAVIESILVCDHDNQQTKITFTVDNAGTTYTIFKEYNITAYDTEELLTRSLFLHQGDVVKIQADRAGNLTVYASIVEYGKGD